MTITVAIPVKVIRTVVVMDHARDWSIVDELILLGLVRGSGVGSLDGLARASGLRYQVVVASLARLMRFRLVEVRADGNAAAFSASSLGCDLVLSGRPLPRFPREVLHRFGFVVDQYSGSYFMSGDVRLARMRDLEREREGGADIRVVAIEQGQESSPHDTSLARLVELMERNGERRLLRVKGRTTVQTDDQLMRVKVVGGVVRNLPPAASNALFRLVTEVAKAPKQAGIRNVGPTGNVVALKSNFEPVACDFNPADLVLGGSAQRALLEDLTARAASRVVLHSTFLHVTNFTGLLDSFRSACIRGVTFDVLWGADEKEEEAGRNAVAARDIAAVAQADPILRGRFRMRLNTTRSHSKMLLADDAFGGWVAVVSSCNWLRSPFGAAEVSVLLRHPTAVADAMAVVQGMVNRAAFADDLVNELFLEERDLRRAGRDVTAENVTSSVRLVVGQAHERLMREVSGMVKRRLVVGSNKLGSTAWTGALMPGELAAERPGVSAIVMYRDATGPLKKRHAKAIAEEAALKGVRVLRTDQVPLHGKFLLWDDDDVVVTSLNWASASTDDSFPGGEVGVHVHSPGLAGVMLSKLACLFPELTLMPTEGG